MLKIKNLLLLVVFALLMQANTVMANFSKGDFVSPSNLSSDTGKKLNGLPGIILKKANTKDSEPERYEVLVWLKKDAQFEKARIKTSDLNLLKQKNLGVDYNELDNISDILGTKFGHQGKEMLNYGDEENVARVIGAYIYFNYGHDAMVYTCEKHMYSDRAVYGAIERAWNRIGRWMS